MHIEIHHKKANHTGRHPDHYELVALFFLDKADLHGKEAYNIAYEVMQKPNQYWLNKKINFRPTAVGDMISVDGKKVLVGQFSFEPAIFK